MAQTATTDSQAAASRFSTAIRQARDRQRVGTGAALDCSRTYIGKLEARGVIQRHGDGFPLDRSRVEYLRYLRRERQPIAAQ